MSKKVGSLPHHAVKDRQYISASKFAGSILKHNALIKQYIDFYFFYIYMVVIMHFLCVFSSKCI